MTEESGDENFNVNELNGEIPSILLFFEVEVTWDVIWGEEPSSERLYIIEHSCPDKCVQAPRDTIQVTAKPREM